ncbi:YusG family protein [Mesobacillus harenae]|uniref:YusG family protein n=1 Tax=Mesobacillus harenae TaxID=2213203 RepID=UPI0015808824|nr:YusG family protein [Mesobacillus harenae]
MTLEPKKLDVTDRIVGKIKNNEIQLYLENEQIGMMVIPEGYDLKLEHHFESNNNKIYQHVSMPSEPEPRYTDCDEGGWC